MGLSSIIRRKQRRERAVVRSLDFRRIADLPRRKEFEDLTEAMTAWLKIPQGTMSLRPIQAWALSEIYQCRGMLGSMAVGSGKTIISHLAPVVLQETEGGCERPLLLVKAALLEKAEADRQRLMGHFRHHPNLRILSYEKLSNINYAKFLFEYMPDAIILDECQNVRQVQRGRGKRVKEYLVEYPNTVVVAMTGSLTRRSIKDYGKLAEWSLKAGTPLPRSWYDICDWADALDENVPDADRVDPGALLDFCENGEKPRLGYRRRFVETPGVITTEESLVDVNLLIRENPIEVPPQVRGAFEKLVKDWELPGGETVSTILDWARHAKELSWGFYNRWNWGDKGVDEEWLEARRNWKRFIHKTIKNSRSVSYDTELQVANAVRDGSLICPADEYNRWIDIRDRANPKTEAVWISDYMIDTTLRWIENPAMFDPPGQDPPECPVRGIAWIEHIPAQERLAQRGAKVFLAGDESIRWSTENCAASLGSHGVGKDLQQYNRNLLPTMPDNATTMEQCIGRTHRGGTNDYGFSQDADTVVFDVFMQCRSNWYCWEKVLRQGEYIEESVAQSQRVDIATIDLRTTEQMVISRALAGDCLWMDYHDGD